MFDKFKKQIQDFAQNMVQGKTIYQTGANGDALYELYLDACSKNGENEIYKTRGEADCSACKHFIRHYGNIVVINSDYTMTSIWDAPDLVKPYDKIAKVMGDFVKSHQIANVFFTDTHNLGTNTSLCQLEDKSIKTWQHLFFAVDKSIVVSFKTDSKEARQGKYREEKEVFGRCFDEITQDSVETVLELVASGTLYRGEEYKKQLDEFLKLTKEFAKVTKYFRDNWLWAKSHNSFVSKIKNTAVGTLLVDISKGEDLDSAVRKFEKIMAPTNYKRPKPIFTKQMLADAEKTVNDLGFGNSLARRHAVASDITVNNVLYVDRNTAPKMKSSPFGDLAAIAKDATVNPKSLSKVEEMGINEFLTNILPTCSSIEALVENRHAHNFCTLIAPEDASAPSMLKWNNNFSWVYNGNITDSMKELVRQKGGRVDGAIRFTHEWNHTGQNQSLMDIHVFMPGWKSTITKSRSNKEVHDHYGSNHRIGWQIRNNPSTGGMQDVDFTSAPGNAIPIENTSFPDINLMPEGDYILKIHNWAAREPNRTGFKAEIEFGNELYQYEYTDPLKNKEWITVATVHLKDKQFTITHHLQPSSIAKDIWGIKTNTFVKVSMVTLSPNYWDTNAVGNKHYMFMLDGCRTSDSVSGFFNEFLKQELDKHKRIFEALSSKMKVPESSEQLSGLGFSSTQRSSVIFRVEGKYKRTIKVNF